MTFGMWTLSEGLDCVAQYEEEEEDQYEAEDPKSRTEFKVTFEDGKESVKTETTLICIGIAATSFVSAYIALPHNAVGEISVVKKTDDNNEKSKSTKSCQIYKDNDTLYCMVKNTVEAKECYDWINTMMAHVISDHVVVLCSSPKSLFVGDNNLKQSDEDLLRCLKSSKAESSTKTSLVEEGNLLKDLPAAVMNYCEMHDVPCILYIAYTESHFIDVFTLKCFQNSFKDQCMQKLKKVPHEELSKRLRNFEGCGVADNNVYI